MDAKMIGGAVVGGVLLIWVVLALLDVARRKLPGNPDYVAKLSNFIAPPPATT